MRCIQYVFIFICISANIYASEDSSHLPWVEINGRKIYVELSTDNATHSKGLSFRDELPEDRGMLFIFSHDRKQRFWMRNTFIPLDIIYLDSNYRVVNMALDVEPCAKDPCKKYPSNVPVRYVLEVNAGVGTSLGLKLGDRVNFVMSLPSSK